MRNFVSPGNAVTANAPVGGVNSGQAVLIGAGLFGVAATTQAAGEEVELATVGVYDLDKAAVAVTAGALAYFDAATSKVTTTSASGANKRVGVFITAAADSDATGRVRLDGSAG